MMNNDFISPATFQPGLNPYHPVHEQQSPITNVQSVSHKFSCDTDAGSENKVDNSKTATYFGECERVGGQYEPRLINTYLEKAFNDLFASDNKREGKIREKFNFSTGASKEVVEDIAVIMAALKQHAELKNDAKLTADCTNWQKTTVEYIAKYGVEIGSPFLTPATKGFDKVTKLQTEILNAWEKRGPGDAFLFMMKKESMPAILRHLDRLVGGGLSEESIRKAKAAGGLISAPAADCVKDQLYIFRKKEGTPHDRMFHLAAALRTALRMPELQRTVSPAEAKAELTADDKKKDLNDKPTVDKPKVDKPKVDLPSFGATPRPDDKSSGQSSPLVNNQHTIIQNLDGLEAPSKHFADTVKYLTDSLNKVIDKLPDTNKFFDAYCESLKNPANTTTTNPAWSFDPSLLRTVNVIDGNDAQQDSPSSPAYSGKAAGLPYNIASSVVPASADGSARSATLKGIDASTQYPERNGSPQQISGSTAEPMTPDQIDGGTDHGHLQFFDQSAVTEKPVIKVKTASLETSPMIGRAQMMAYQNGMNMGSVDSAIDSQATDVRGMGAPGSASSRRDSYSSTTSTLSELDFDGNAIDDQTSAVFNMARNDRKSLADAGELTAASVDTDSNMQGVDILNMAAPNASSLRKDVDSASVVPMSGGLASTDDAPVSETTSPSFSLAAPMGHFVGNALASSGDLMPFKISEHATRPFVDSEERPRNSLASASDRAAQSRAYPRAMVDLTSLSAPTDNAASAEKAGLHDGKDRKRSDSVTEKMAQLAAIDEDTPLTVSQRRSLFGEKGNMSKARVDEMALLTSVRKHNVSDPSYISTTEKNWQVGVFSNRK